MMTDKELEMLMKKASRKQLVKVTSISVLIVMALLVIGTLTYNKHYNKWPFSTGKIAGVPDNTIIRVQETNQFTNLLFPAQENLLFNTRGNRVVVYMERYEKSTLKETKELVALSADTALDNDLSGSVQWGMIDWGVTEDNIRIALKVNGNEATASYTLKTQEDSVSVNTGIGYESLDLDNKIPVLIGFWGAGKDQTNSAIYDENGFHKEDLEINSESFALFIKVI